MRKIIIYGSKYGTSKEYAIYLGLKTNITVVNYKDLKNINKYDTIIYVGSIYASNILGLRKTFKKLNNINNKNIYIITVGMSETNI